MTEGGGDARGLAPTLPLGAALLPVLVAAGWMLLVSAGGGLGAAIYFGPLLVAAGLVAAFVAAGTAVARPVAIGLMLVVVVAGLNVAFSPRQEGEVGLTPQNGVKLVTWTVLALVAVVQWRRLAAMLRDPVFALAAAHVAVAGLSMTWSLAPTYTAANALGLFGYLGLACLVASRLPEGTAFRVMVWSLFALIAGGLVAGVILPDMSWLPPSQGEPVVRFQGVSGHPNVYAQQAGYLMVLATSARRAGHLSRRVFLMTAAVALAAILLSDSRTTLLACLLSWGLVALRQRRLMPLVGVCFCVLAAVATILFATGGMAQIGALVGGVSRSGSSSELTTLTGRTEIWALAWDLIQQRPLLGWGFNATEQLISDSLPTTFYGSHVNCHNMTIQLVLTLGFLGAIPGLGFVAALLYRAVVRPDPARDQTTFFMFISGLTESPIFVVPSLQNLVVFYFIARDAQAARREPLPQSPVQLRLAA